MGFETTPIDLGLTVSMKFIDCYKVIITDLCDFTSSWTGYDAKWLDNCDQSQDANIDLSTWNIVYNSQDKVLLGTVNPTSKLFCWPLPLIGKSAANEGIAESDSPLERFAKYSYSNAASYLIDNYGDQLGIHK